MRYTTLRPRRRRGATARPRALRRGVTIVEMVVAIVVLAIGIIGLAGTAAMVARQMTGGAQQTVAATVAQTRFERLASVSCAALIATPSGTSTFRGITESWTVIAGSNGTLRLDVTLSYPTSRGPRSVSYASMRAC